MEYQRVDVKEFANSMEAKLRTKDGEYGIRGWGDSSCNISYLIDRLEEEVEELKEAFKDCNPDAVCNETFDVGNFAMMIHCRVMMQRRRFEKLIIKDNDV